MNLFNMTNPIKFLFIFSFFGLASNISAQQETGAPINYNIDMFPKTPEAASLGKFIDIPPGDYTGVAAFSIPIYSFEVDGLKFPIELNYSTSGIKVSEIASRVGLGWSLNAGGISLSKQVIGTPDREDGQRPVIMDVEFDADGTGNGNDPDIMLAFQVLGIEAFSAEAPLDIKPDIYSYSLASGSGKYILDSSGDFGIPIPYNQIKIKPSGAYQNIKDEDGNDYIFAKGLGIRSYNTCNNEITPLLHYPDPNYRITKVKTKKNNEISFNYTKSVNSHYVTSMVEQKKIFHKRVGLAIGPAENLPPKCYNHTYSNEEILTQINFPGGSVHFLYNDDIKPPLSREDLPGDYFLRQVIVKDLHGKTIKEVTLHYDNYFESPNSGGYSGEMYLGINKRLKLTRVTDNLTGGEYKLSYYEDNVLPHRLSNSQDFWGVYNGKENLETSIPTTFYKDQNLNNEPYKLELGANKQPDITFGVTGNLKRITYPTGGFTHITYEADDYFQSLYAPPAIYNYIPGEVETESPQTSPQSFSIIQRPLNMMIEFTGDNDDGSGSANIENCKLEIFKGTNPTPVFESAQYGHFLRYDTFETGNYSIKLIPGLDQSTFEPVNCDARLSWQEQQLVDNSSYRKTGTIRIQKIESEDAVTGKITREFTYLDPTTNYTQTSGKNLGDEYLMALYTKVYPFDRQTGTYMTELIASNNPGWQISTVRGKPIGYEYVQEIYKSPTESFKKEHRFTNDTDDAWTNHNSYNPINYTWPVEGIKRGLKRYEKIFDKDNQLKQKTEYEYEYDSKFNENATTHPAGTALVAHGLEINLNTISCTDLGCYYTFTEEAFPIKNYWIKNVKTRTVEYRTPYDSLYTEQILNYSPEYKHTFLSNKITNGSFGENLRKEYYYPEDLSSYYEQSDLMSRLVQRNQVSYPVITKTFQDGKVISEVRNKYAHFYYSNNDVSSGFILPQFIYLKKGEIGPTAQSEDRKITYDSFDEKGNLTQYTMENGIPVSIIWGYNKKHPIAKIEGAAYSTISTTLINNAVNASNADQNETTENTLRTRLEELRNASALSNAFITTYTYDPLVGVTTVVAPNGQESFFKYDAAGRLEKVLDKDKKALKEMEYHYKN